MSDVLDGMFGGRPDWLAALLSVEAALARAKAAVGRIPDATAQLVVRRCRPELFDAADIAQRTESHATPVIAVVEDIRSGLPADAADAVHTPATSQDIVDSALMTLAAAAIDALRPDLAACDIALVELATRYRDTPQQGRTLLARALPTTFGRLAATWSAGLADARAELSRVRDTLAVQLGGPVGTLDDPELLRAFAAELRLAVPAACWHTNRVPVARLAAALGLVVGALGKIAGDVVLLAQAELGEVTEGTPGGSSAMPDKRNSARSVQIMACAQQAPALVGTVFGALPQELQRAAGRWQAEWRPVGDLLALTGAAARHARVLLGELRVAPDRMREGLR